MKLKTRLFIAFLTVILLPICLTVLMYFAFSTYQIGAIEKTYGIEPSKRHTELKIQPERACPTPCRCCPG